MFSKIKNVIVLLIIYLLFVLWYFNSTLFTQFGFGHWSLILFTSIFFCLFIKFTLGFRPAKFFIIGLILFALLFTTPAIFQEKYPVPALLGAAKIEMSLTKISKISNNPLKYIVKEGSYGELDNGIKIVHAEGRTEWDQDFIIDGNRYRSDWVIYLGLYRIYTLNPF